MALIVGVDIGQSSVKAVVLRTLVRGYAPVLYRQAPLTPVAAGGARPAAEVAAALAALVEAGLPKGEVVVSALPGGIASAHFLDLPFADPKKIEKVIPFEVEAHVPFPLEGMQLAFQVIEKKGTGARVLVAVASVEALTAHIEALKNASLDPWIVDCDLTALYTLAMARIAADPGSGTYAVVDLGASHTGLALVVGQKLAGVRSLGAGGNAITSGLASVLGVPFAEADRIKREFGEAVGLDAGLSAAPGGDARKIAEGIRAGLDRIVRDLKPALLSLEAREKVGIERVHLVGGGANLDGVGPYLGRALGVEARPLDVGEFPAGEASPGPEAACAFGLALRGARGTTGSALNFRRGENAYRREAREIAGRILPAAWPIAVIVLLALVSFTIRCSVTTSRYESLREERSRIFAEAFHAPEGPDLMKQAKVLVDKQRKRLALLGGASSPLETLREIVSRVPIDANLLVNELEADPERITFTALADSFEQVGRVRSDLAGSPEFSKVEVSNQAKEKDKVRFAVSIQLTRGGE